MENRPIIPNRPGFVDLMRPGERIAAFIYLPIHVFVLPLLLPRLAYVWPAMTAVDMNLIYYVTGFVYMLVLFWRFLRAGFNAALDRLGAFVLSLITAYMLELVLSMLLSYALAILGGENMTSPNNDAIISMVPEGWNKLVAMTVFMAPFVEEIIFRGLLFGAFYRRSRVLAWVVSALAFSLYHVWQYAFNYGDLTYLLAAVLYLPASLAFNWCYERSGSIWAPIAYHMISNAIGMSLM